jgi:DNA-binding LacI/PurR family transcriptional regulator
VLVDAESADPTVSSAVPDEVDGAVTAVGELLKHGHRRIAFINNAHPTLAAAGRLEGYERALGRAGIEVDPTLIVAATDMAGPWSEEPIVRWRRPRPFACSRVAALVAVLVMFLAPQRQFIRSIASAGAKG